MPSPEHARGPEGEPFAALRETHTSVVLLLGDRAYKVKKPVALPFVDLSTRELRLADCRDEVDLNRRISPDVYLGVGELPAPADEAGPEPVVVMRRMPEVRRLSTLLAGPDEPEDAARCALDAARQVAALHAGLPGLPDYDLPGTMERLWREGREQTRVFEGRLLDPAALDEAHALAAEYLAGREPMLRARQAAGLVRDGHGDLLTEDVFCLDDGARVLDCLEFDPLLRVGDVLLDIGFLAMDLSLHGHPDLARRVVDRYRELTAEAHPASLERHYVAYRAWVRAKVECLRSDGGDAAATGRARAALELCRRELRTGRVHLVLVGGLPATGKSTLAARVVDEGEADWVLLNSDELRKEQAGVAPGVRRDAAWGEGIYDTAHTHRVYAELLRRATVALHGGMSVVLDASWSTALHRAAAAAVARECAVPLTEIRCTAPDEVSMTRLSGRAAGEHVSDATPEVLRRMADHADPWPGAVEVDTATSTPEQATARVLAAVAARPASSLPGG